MCSVIQAPWGHIAVVEEKLHCCLFLLVKFQALMIVCSDFLMSLTVVLYNSSNIQAQVSPYVHTHTHWYGLKVEVNGRDEAHCSHCEHLG